LQLTADNRADGWVDLPAAVRSGRAFLVVPAPRLLCLDLDLTGLDADETTRRIDAFERLTGRLRTHAVPHMVTASGRAGHRHLYVVVGTLPTHLRAAVERRCRQDGLDVRTRGIRPPLAPHRLGYPVALLTPDDPTRAREVLTAAAPPVADVAAVFGVSAVGLSARMWRLLRDGHTTAGYTSASHGRMALAVAARAAGLPGSWLDKALTDPRNQLGESFRSRDDRWRAVELDRLVRKADLHLAASPPRPAPTEQLQRFRAALRAVPWRGTGGATDLAVCEALAAVADTAGTCDVRVARSTLALAAGCHELTVRRSLRRLQAAGWIRLLEAPTPTAAARWRLLVPAHVPAEQLTTAGHAPVTLGIDLARHRGLGQGDRAGVAGAHLGSDRAGHARRVAAHDRAGGAAPPAQARRVRARTPRRGRLGARHGRPGPGRGDPRGRGRRRRATARARTARRRPDPLAEGTAGPLARGPRQRRHRRLTTARFVRPTGTPGALRHARRAEIDGREAGSYPVRPAVATASGGPDGPGDEPSSGIRVGPQNDRSGADGQIRAS
jgi:hypothetical protein